MLIKGTPGWGLLEKALDKIFQYVSEPQEKSLRSISPRGCDLPIRYRLDDERRSFTVEFTLYNENEKGLFTTVEGHFTFGFYDDGTPGEVFVEMGKHGYDLNGFANCWAIAISMLLQYGVPAEEIINKFKGRNFRPNGITQLPSIPIPKSVVDLVVRWLENHLSPKKKDLTNGEKEWKYLIEKVSDQ